MKDKLRELYQASPPLAVTGWVQWILALVFLTLAPFDSRTILGISPWIKPMKFSVSIAIYVWTLAWLLRYLSRHAAAVKRISWCVAFLMMGEITIIALQSARGVPSHFNIATPLDAALFSIMGTMIGVNTALLVWVTALFFVDAPELPPAYLWGIRFGLTIFLLASFEGVFIVSHGSHTVGAPDGGSGFPFVNWSRQHGDLRVAHFAGMHALQVLPLVGYWLSRSRTSERAQILYTSAAFGLYFAIVLSLFWLALLGRPLTL
ncbi:MAG TPA: hypothetical protein VKT81_26415 [Bryobacteraceae bacterium]|nr:hypothetical protein [Bryobacteraceae bacterium]